MDIGSSAMLHIRISNLLGNLLEAYPRRFEATRDSADVSSIHYIYDTFDDFLMQTRSVEENLPSSFKEVNLL